MFDANKSVMSSASEPGAAVLCPCRPNVFSWEKVLGLSPVERLDHAFTVAKDQLAIERLLDPEGSFNKRDTEQRHNALLLLPACPSSLPQPFSFTRKHLSPPSLCLFRCGGAAAR